MIRSARSRAHQLVLAAAVLFPLAVLVLELGVSPVPSSIVLKAYTDKFADATAVDTDHYTPSAKLLTAQSFRYSPGGGQDHSIQVFRPISAEGNALPTVVWIHGGGWLGGDASDVSPYLRRIASSNFTTIAVNYPLAPGDPYPASIMAVNQAVGYILANASTLGVDSSHIILAGDDAGANLASQLAGLVTNPEYADRTGIHPVLVPGQLRGVALAGGVYDTSTVRQIGGLTGLKTRLELWSYTGSRQLDGSEMTQQISTINGVSAAFPATWITGGSADPLTRVQADPFASRLGELGVPVTAVFPTSAPNLPSQYQFMLGLPEARETLNSLLMFLHSSTDS